jgi:tRNA pseudouridine55 synthase
MDGILVVDKAEGYTSADVVRLVKGRLRCKVGHLGTLDPLATGVLPLCLGEGTKIAQFLTTADKTYVGCIRIGTATDTGDRAGRVVRHSAVPDIARRKLDEIALSMLGEQLQTPPMYSAIKRAGVPLYKLARAGREVSRQPRRITIRHLAFRLIAVDLVEFEVHCSKGTYVRVLAEDLGARLGSAAHLESLRRTVFGPFRLTDAVTVDALRDGLPAQLLSLRVALPHLREIAVDEALARGVRSGQEAALTALPKGASPEIVKLIDPEGELAAIVSATVLGEWRFERVFSRSSPPPRAPLPPV